MHSLWHCIQKTLNANSGLGTRFPPFAHAVVMSGCDISHSKSAYGLENIIHDMRILLGVPKHRTSKPRKQTRKFSYTRLLEPTNDLVACASCGSFHQVDTICGNCYEKVRQLTNEIKRKMMAYNPYKGEQQDKEVVVRFSNDNIVEDGVFKGKRVIEIEKERPTWFKKLF